MLFRSISRISGSRYNTDLWKRKWCVILHNDLSIAYMYETEHKKTHIFKYSYMYILHVWLLYSLTENRTSVLVVSIKDKEWCSRLANSQENITHKIARRSTDHRAARNRQYSITKTNMKPKKRNWTSICTHTKMTCVFFRVSLHFGTVGSLWFVSVAYTCISQGRSYMYHIR